ncbi:hypothetical protein [Phenylobacterium sp.]|uniref:hypothetical protein n=1 Tax=Phenylobacterium sp. TaxID=1871053 RepID=UPI002BD32DA2|nr:hypothetical protein [Phenylobacterium sp.]HLZ74904.1 hypothetical protein [Phenylobacterium sp.]
MNRLAPLGRKLAGFFVDDAFLGGATVASVLAASLCRAALATRPLIAGALLAGGCVLALTLSVVRAAARPPT